MKRCCIIAHHVETAALSPTFRTKSTYDDMTATFHRERNLVNIREPVLWRPEKVENRAVVPDVVRPLRKTTGLNAQHRRAFSREFQGSLRDIEHRDVSVSGRDQVIHECRSTSATSIIELEQSLARSISASDVSRWARNQLTCSGDFVAYTFCQCCCTSIIVKNTGVRPAEQPVR